MSNFLFALDAKKEEIIVSESPKGSKTIHLIERISRSKNDMLYNAVKVLTDITQSADFDSSIFKAMDKVCQFIYIKSKETK
jgi:hypothetical protein